MDNIGIIPIILTSYKETLNFSFESENQMSYKEIFKSLSNFLKYLKLYDKTKYGMKYIESGLPVHYDKDSIQSYNKAMKSDKSFNDFLHFASYKYDQAANMDW